MGMQSTHACERGIRDVPYAGNVKEHMHVEALGGSSLQPSFEKEEEEY